MSALHDLPPAHTTSSPAERLRARMAAARVAVVWLGIHKTLTAAQKEQAAEGFGAQREFLSAGKKRLDTSHPAFKAVTATIEAIQAAGLREGLSVMVGGAAASQLLCDKAGCDYYGRTAVDGLHYACQVAGIG